MVAPALIMLAPGVSQEAEADVYRELARLMTSQRPALDIRTVFANGADPTLDHVITQLHDESVREAVIVPLDVTRSSDLNHEMSDAINAISHLPQPPIVAVADPLGPASSLLGTVDIKLRDALAAVHANELDGLVLAVAERGDARGSTAIGHRSRQWSARHKLPVTLAYIDGSGPDVTEAIHSLHAQGRRHTAVGTTLIAPGEAYVHMTEQALAADAIAVSRPLGVDQRLADLVTTRYAWTAMEMLDRTQDDPNET